MHRHSLTVRTGRSPRSASTGLSAPKYQADQADQADEADEADQAEDEHTEPEEFSAEEQSWGNGVLTWLGVILLLLLLGLGYTMYFPEGYRAHRDQQRADERREYVRLSLIHI